MSELLEEFTPLELARIVPLDEAARLRGVSPDTLKREEASKILKIGKRRLGMRLRDALMLGNAV